jgi:glyoxylase-like metal-dependent hydrolase (beta-lactamase superfamily II)
MIEMFGKVWPAMPKRVINTHEDGDHVWGDLRRGKSRFTGRIPKLTMKVK